MEFWIGFATLTLTLFATLFGIFKYFNARTSAIYTKLDCLREELKRDYVQKDSCKLIDSHRSSDITRIEAKLDSIYVAIMTFKPINGGKRDGGD